MPICHRDRGGYALSPGRRRPRNAAARGGIVRAHTPGPAGRYPRSVFDDLGNGVRLHDGISRVIIGGRAVELPR